MASNSRARPIVVFKRGELEEKSHEKTFESHMQYSSIELIPSVAAIKKDKNEKFSQMGVTIFDRIRRNTPLLQLIQIIDVFPGYDKVYKQVLQKLLGENRLPWTIAAEYAIRYSGKTEDWSIDDHVDVIRSYCRLGCVIYAHRMLEVMVSKFDEDEIFNIKTNMNQLLFAHTIHTLLEKKQTPSYRGTRTLCLDKSNPRLTLDPKLSNKNFLEQFKTNIIDMRGADRLKPYLTDEFYGTLKENARYSLQGLLEDEKSWPPNKLLSKDGVARHILLYGHDGRLNMGAWRKKLWKSGESYTSYADVIAPKVREPVPKIEEHVNYKFECADFFAFLQDCNAIEKRRRETDDIINRHHPVPKKSKSKF